MNSKELKKEKQKWLDYLKINNMTKEEITFKEWIEEKED